MRGLLFHYEDEPNIPNMGYWEATPLSFEMVPLCVDLSEDQRWAHRDGSFATIQEAQEQHADHLWVYLEVERLIPAGIPYKYLHDFVHPVDNVIYVIGPNSAPEGYKLDELGIRSQDKVVTIRNPRRSPNFAMESGLVAASVVYDRWFKVGYDIKWPPQS